jgi:hypothetical protein
MDICNCFLDTNTFLHYRHFMEVNWPKELTEERVVLIICSTVLNELDRKKHSEQNVKIRERAKSIISKLNELSEKDKPVKIRDNVELFFLIGEPNIDWTFEGLDQAVYDDRLIATIIGESKTNNNIVLVTADLGLKLKAKARGIDCRSLSEELFLQPEKTAEEKELIRLREELKQLRNSMPELGLHVKEGSTSDIKCFSLKKITPLSEVEIEDSLNELRKKLQYISPILRAQTLALSGIWPSEEEIERYRIDVEKYISRMHDYYVEELKYKSQLSKIIELQFILENKGGCPAEDIEVFTYFPDGFDLHDGSGLPKEPFKPELPTSPQSLFEKMKADIASYADNFNRFNYTGIPFLPFKPFNPVFRSEAPSGPHIKIINSYEVRYALQKLKHGFLAEFDPIYVLFPSIEEAKSFHIEYQIHAANHPKPFKGKLQIVLKTEN